MNQKDYINISIVLVASIVTLVLKAKGVAFVPLVISIPYNFLKFNPINNFLRKVW